MSSCILRNNFSIYCQCSTLNILKVNTVKLNTALIVVFALKVSNWKLQYHIAVPYKKGVQYFTLKQKISSSYPDWLFRYNHFHRTQIDDISDLKHVYYDVTAFCHSYIFLCNLFSFIPEIKLPFKNDFLNKNTEPVVY